MPGTSLYNDVEYDPQLDTDHFDSLDLVSQDDSVSDTVPSGMEVEYADASSLPSRAKRNTTDLVRLYLQEIGKVDLLGRDEEVSEAQKVQQYVSLLEVRRQAAEARPDSSRA